MLGGADLAEGWLTDHPVSVHCNGNDGEGGHEDCHAGHHLHQPAGQD